MFSLLTETRYCYTQHTMEVSGNSISVTKRCVPLEDCLSTGCRDSEHEGHKVWQKGEWWDTIDFLLSRCPLGPMSSMSLLPHVGWLLNVFIPIWKDASFHVGAKRIKNYIRITSINFVNQYKLCKHNTRKVLKIIVKFIQLRMDKAI